MMVNENVMNKIDAVVDELAQKFEPVLDKIYEFVDRDWEQIADDFLTKQAHNIYEGLLWFGNVLRNMMFNKQ